MQRPPADVVQTGRLRNEVSSQEVELKTLRALPLNVQASAISAKPEGRPEVGCEHT